MLSYEKSDRLSTSVDVAYRVISNSMVDLHAQSTLKRSRAALSEEMEQALDVIEETMTLIHAHKHLVDVSWWHRLTACILIPRTK